MSSNKKSGSKANANVGPGSDAKSKSKTSKNNTKKAEMAIEDVYKRKTHHQHILDLPDTYIGSTRASDSNMFIINPDYDETEDNMPQIIDSLIRYIPGFFKIFDEIVVNARDHSVKDPTCKNIRITISRETGIITVWNDGNGIPVAYHKEQKMYLPEMLFGHLLTSSNYDVTGKIVGGKNGYGSKACSIYSRMFKVHTIGYNELQKTKKSEKIEYEQVFSNNMYDIGLPKLNGIEVDVKAVGDLIEKNGDLSILKKHIPQTTKTFTEISYLPDYERFGMTGLTNDMYNLLVKRCYDIAACTISAGVKVYINDSEIKCKDFNSYVKMYYSKKDSNGKSNQIKTIHEKVNSRWEIAVGFSTDTREGDRYISFVNGISTFQGGFHVDHVVSNIVKKVIEHILAQKEHKDLKIDPKMVKQFLTFFVNAVVEDPSFNSQTKERLDSKIADWCAHKPACQDVRCEISSDFIDKLCKTGLMKEVVALSQFKESRELSKGEKGKVSRLTDIPKLIDAELAGTRNSAQASIMFTEGDTAKSFAVSGLGVIGSKNYGVFPLRGKLLNVRNATVNQIKKCAEFNNIKAILGLRQGKKYSNVSELRYGSVISLTDQDPDGSHIKGLLINIFEYFWPELLQMDGFMKAYITYIVKAWKKTDKKKAACKIFYTTTEFEAWKKTVDMSKWNYKYYKGLGTSTEQESRESFKDFADNLITFKWEDNNAVNTDTKELEKLKAKLEAKADKDAKTDKSDKADKSDKSDKADKSDKSDKSDKASKAKEDAETVELEADAEADAEADIESGSTEEIDEEFAYTLSKSHTSIVKAFDDTRADDRKDWLKAYRPEDSIQYTKGMGSITYTEFIDKDLRIFSTYDNVRSIASMIDGLKPSQRMVLFSAFKKGRNAPESKVAQFGAYVSENTDYHHGEASLFGTIINMAQNFPGSNNINLLEPNGNFGYRRMGGAEAGAPRYIYTCLTPITNTIFRSEDDEILDYNYVDGTKVEPKNFEPIMPMVLVNGGHGIGTGYSFNIPPYNPKDIVLNLKRVIKGQQPIDMIPWYNGYKNNAGTKTIGPNKYEFTGLYDINGKTVRITEIPIYNGWIEPYEEVIESKLSLAKDDGKLIADISKKVMNNSIDMTLTFRGNDLQTLYQKNTLEKFLNMRKTMSFNSMYLFDENNTIHKYDSASQIIQEFYAHRIKVYGVRKAYWLKKLENDLNIYKYKVKFIKEYLNNTIKIARVTSAKVLEQLEEKGYPRFSNDHRSDDSTKSYRYLTDMSLMSLTTDKIEELEKKTAECQAEYDDYLNTPVEQIWLRELDEFEKAYSKFCDTWKELNEHNETVDPKDKGKGKGKAKGKGRGKTDTADKSKTEKSKTDAKSLKIEKTGAKVVKSTKSARDSKKG